MNFHGRAGIFPNEATSLYLFQFMKHSSNKSSKTLPNLTSSMTTSKAHATLGLNKKGEIQPRHSLHSTGDCALTQPRAQT